MSKHKEFMSRAIQLAKRGLRTTMPNPRVGCVLEKDGHIVAEGFHRKAGEGHAEVNALAAAGEQARGATCYVTLEPCAHSGRTGPCAEALVEAGVARVVYGMEDPNPAVAGRGLAILRAAGIAVEGPLLEDQCRQLNLGFISRMEQGLPYVRCKQACSLDGRTAMASGESKWITAPAARRDVQRLRARSCAVISGIGTVLHDNPSLTVRAEELGLPAEQALAAAEHQPLRVIVDSRLRTPPSALLFKAPGAVLIVCARRDAEKAAALEARGAEIIELPGADGQVDLKALLHELARRECNEVLVEAGAALAGTFLRQALVNELWIYMAQVLMGSSARPLFELPVETMSCKLHLSWRDVRRVGDDLRIIAEPDYEG